MVNSMRRHAGCFGDSLVECAVPFFKLRVAIGFYYDKRRDGHVARFFVLPRRRNKTTCTFLFSRAGRAKRRAFFLFSCRRRAETRSLSSIRSTSCPDVAGVRVAVEVRMMLFLCFNPCRYGCPCEPTNVDAASFHILSEPVSVRRPSSVKKTGTISLRFPSLIEINKL